MINFLSKFFSFITFLLLSHSILAQENIIKPPLDNRNYGYEVLDNGLRVVVVSDPSSAVSTAVLLVEVGSYQDPKDFPGMAHYLEHMVIQSSKKYPQINGLKEVIEKIAVTSTLLPILNLLAILQAFPINTIPRFLHD